MFDDVPLPSVALPHTGADRPAWQLKQEMTGSPSAGDSNPGSARPQMTVGYQGAARSHRNFIFHELLSLTMFSFQDLFVKNHYIPSKVSTKKIL